MKKNTVRSGKKNAAASTQRYLQFAGARDDVLILQNGGIRAILEIASINFNLKSDAEKKSIIAGYQNFLNSLNFPVQILVKSRKLDIDQYLGNLKNQQKKIENELLKNQMVEYIEYITKLVEFTDIMEKKFFVIVPTDPLRAAKKGALAQFLRRISPDDKISEIIRRKKEFKNLKKELESRVNVVKTALENCGLNVTQLSTEKIIEIFYQSFNPSRSRTQKIGPLAEMSVAEIDENLVPDEN